MADVGIFASTHRPRCDCRFLTEPFDELRDEVPVSQHLEGGSRLAVSQRRRATALVSPSNLTPAVAPQPRCNSSKSGSNSAHRAMTASHSFFSIGGVIVSFTSHPRNDRLILRGTSVRLPLTIAVRCGTVRPTLIFILRRQGLFPFTCHFRKEAIRNLRRIR